MDITKKITTLISDAVSSLQYDISTDQIDVEKPKNTDMGDYSTNIAMKCAKTLQRNPMELANEIAEQIAVDDSIEKIEVVQPGFINFFVSDKYLQGELLSIVQKGNEYFKSEEKKGKRVVIEYTDANPFKVMHTGHLYTNIVGESFARLQRALGADVKCATYQGDVGLHVAKTMWGLKKKFNEENRSFNDLEELSLGERVKYLGEAYILGAEAYDESDDESTKNEIEDINYYIYSLSVPSLLKKDHSMYEEIGMERWYLDGRKWCLEYFEKIYEQLGTKFDYYFLESEVGEVGLQLVLANVGKVFKEDDGAVIYEGDPEKNLHTRVFVNRYGLPTYEAKELGLAFEKYKKIKYDESVVITGKEQKGYFSVVLDALEKIDADIVKGTKHIPHGLIKTPSGEKMSSRRGGFVSAEWLIEKTSEKVADLMKKNGKFDESNIDELSSKIAVGAIKYAFLRVGVGSDIVFDFDKSITFDGNTGPYLMYVYSRCNSLLKDVDIDNEKVSSNMTVSENILVRELLRSLSNYKPTLLNSAVRLAPSDLCEYLFDLGQKFNAFYQNVRILDADENDRDFLLLLVKATMIVMENGLDYLGIKKVEVM